MPDKNRDFSQVRAGTVVAFDGGHYRSDCNCKVEVSSENGWNLWSEGLVGRWVGAGHWAEYGGYIVSQPEAQDGGEQTIVRRREERQVAVICENCDGDGFLPSEHGLCRFCEGQGQIYPDDAEVRGASEQRGTDAVHDKPVAYGDPDTVFAPIGAVPQYFEVSDHKQREYTQPLYTAPQPDTQAATIAEQAAMIATLREAIRKAAETVMSISTPCMKDENLAVTLCYAFDDREEVDYDTNWPKASSDAYEEIKNAIEHHFEQALAATEDK